MIPQRYFALQSATTLTSSVHWDALFMILEKQKEEKAKKNVINLGCQNTKME